MTAVIDRFFKQLLLTRGKRLVRLADPKKVRHLLAEMAPRGSRHPLIRVGAANDGGYLVPDDLESIDGVFSPGVSTVSDFEYFFAARGIPVWMIDASVEGPGREHSNFHFSRYFLGTRDGGDFVRLDSWMNGATASRDLLLQMDIEGAEWAVLVDAERDLLRRFRIMVIEFHGFDSVIEPGGFELVNGVFQKLLRDFFVVHAHPNNNRTHLNYKGILIPPVLELTFLRRDRSESMEFLTEFPHALDSANNPAKDDVVMPVWKF